MCCVAGQLALGADFVGLFDGHGGSLMAAFSAKTLPGFYVCFVAITILRLPFYAQSDR